MCLTYLSYQYRLVFGWLSNSSILALTHFRILPWVWLIVKSKYFWSDMFTKPILSWVLLIFKFKCFKSDMFVKLKCHGSTMFAKPILSWGLVDCQTKLSWIHIVLGLTRFPDSYCLRFGWLSNPSISGLAYLSDPYYLGFDWLSNPNTFGSSAFLDPYHLNTFSIYKIFNKNYIFIVCFQFWLLYAIHCNIVISFQILDYVVISLLNKIYPLI